MLCVSEGCSWVGDSIRLLYVLVYLLVSSEQLLVDVSLAIAKIYVLILRIKKNATINEPRRKLPFKTHNPEQTTPPTCSYIPNLKEMS